MTHANIFVEYTQQAHDVVKTLESGWILVGLVATKSDV